jgi:phage terminase small subunit
MTGAFKHNPARRRARAKEPVPNGPLGDPPSHLAPQVGDCWNYLRATALPGVLCEADSAIVEVGARLLLMVGISDTCSVAALAQLRVTLAELGMTPASRSKVMAMPYVPPPGAAGLNPDGRPLTGNIFADL